jgi:magnesium-transporting ATPase (P-type)
LYSAQSPITEFASRHGTVINQQSPKTSVGLTASEAAARLERDGPNQFTPKELKPAWLKYLLQFTDPFMVQLLNPMSTPTNMLFMIFHICDRFCLKSPVFFRSSPTRPIRISQSTGVRVFPSSRFSVPAVSQDSHHACFCFYVPDLGALLEGVTFLSCTYAHFQEGQATSAMAAFKSMLPQKATGMRDQSLATVTFCAS